MASSRLQVLLQCRRSENQILVCGTTVNYTAVSKTPILQKWCWYCILHFLLDSLPNLTYFYFSSHLKKKSVMPAGTICDQAKQAKLLYAAVHTTGTSYCRGQWSIYMRVKGLFSWRLTMEARSWSLFQNGWGRCARNGGCPRLTGILSSERGFLADIEDVEPLRIQCACLPAILFFIDAKGRATVHQKNEWWSFLSYCLALFQYLYPVDIFLCIRL